MKGWKPAKLCKFSRFSSNNRGSAINSFRFPLSRTSLLLDYIFDLTTFETGRNVDSSQIWEHKSQLSFYIHSILKESEAISGCGCRAREGGCFSEELRSVAWTFLIMFYHERDSVGRCCGLQSLKMTSPANSGEETVYLICCHLIVAKRFSTISYDLV